jgi:hypothetical protein
MGTAVRPAKTSPGPWDAFADVDVFVDEVLAELEAMAKEGARPLRSGPKPPLARAALRKAVMAIWCVCFCGMQWRAIGQLCDIPFGTLYVTVRSAPPGSVSKRMHTALRQHLADPALPGSGRGSTAAIHGSV